jgi:putative ABC transport system permease protein
MGTLSRDFRYAARMLGKNPSFTFVSVLTLALGIGVNTAIFSLMNALILRPLPVRDPEQLVLISEAMLKGRGRRSPTMSAYLTWKRSSQTLQDIALAGFCGDPTTLSGTGLAERVSEAYCGLNFLPMLGVKPFRGRLFLPEDAPSGEGTTVVISEELWQRTFGADPNVLGRTVVLADSKKTIVGVLPRGFSVFPWDMHVDVWLAYNETAMSTLRWIPKLGRLKPGVTIQQAQAELNAIS